MITHPSAARRGTGHLEPTRPGPPGCLDLARPENSADTGPVASSQAAGTSVGTSRGMTGMRQHEQRPLVGGLSSRFPDVRRIAVLRGGGLGDLIFALPAVAALAAAYPQAEVTLLGTPLHAALLAGRPGPVDAVEVLPPRPGVQPGEPDPVAQQEFGDRVRARRLDLAVQLHGGGRNSNPFLLELGARHTVGSRTPDAVALERSLPYLYYQHEVLRALEVVGLAGAAPVDLEPRVELTPAEHAARERALAGRDRPLLLLHPGATDPRRRWPAPSFAQVAASVAADGASVVVIGDESDVETADRIVGGARRLGADDAVTSQAGLVPLAELVGLLASGTVLLANDSGPRHLAQAVGTPTVGVFWVGNVLNAAPLSRGRHRIEFSFTRRCPVCGRDCTRVDGERCEHDDSFVAEVSPAAVLADVRELIGAEVGSSPR